MEKTKSRNLFIFLLSIITIIILLGILILGSASAPDSASFTKNHFGNIDPTYFLFNQIIRGFIPGILLAIFAYKIKLETLKKITPMLLFGNLVLLIMVFLPVVGTGLKGASRWVNLSFISIQPSEFLKLTFILYLSAWLSSRTEKKSLKFLKKNKHFSQTFLAFILVIGIVSGLLISQPDISTMAIIFIIAISLYFLSETPLMHTILFGPLGVTGLIILIKIAPYRLQRLLVFLDPNQDPLGSGYQIKQSLIAIGSGGIIGRGLGQSIQKFGFLPETRADSIFSVFSEEAGFIGAIFLILLFLSLFIIGLQVGKNSSSKFGQLTAWGISIWIMLQTSVNISSMTGLLPLTGIPLPFISSGGSAILTELVGMGILLNIAKHNRT